jgi:hypothetical protein
VLSSYQFLGCVSLQCSNFCAEWDGNLIFKYLYGNFALETFTKENKEAGPICFFALRADREPSAVGQHKTLKKVVLKSDFS